MGDETSGRPLFLPGGVAERAARIGYVAGGGVEALNLLTGEALWQATVAARPVLVYEQKVAALQTVAGLDNALQVVALQPNLRADDLRKRRCDKARR